MSKDAVHPRGIITNAIGDTLDELPMSRVMSVQIAVWEALAAAGYAVVPMEDLQMLGDALCEGWCGKEHTDECNRISAMIAAAKGEA